MSVKTIRKFCPWVRNIYFVTQRPQNPNIEDVIVIYHDQILPDEALPTFSSLAIESSLHKIPGLSEQFIYFNDDFYCGQPLNPLDFFTIDGIPIFRKGKRVWNWFKYLDLFNAHTIINLNSSLKLQNIIDKIKYWFLLHQATPCTRSIMFEAESIFRDEWEKTQNSKFRSYDTISPFGLSLNLAYNNGDCIGVNKGKDTITTKFVNVKKIDNIINLKDPPHLFCINNVENENELKNIKIYTDSLIL